jgi:hypothetical protein
MVLLWGHRSFQPVVNGTAKACFRRFFHQNKVEATLVELAQQGKQPTGGLFEVARGAQHKLLLQRNMRQRLAEAQPGGFGEVGQWLVCSTCRLTGPAQAFVGRIMLQQHAWCLWVGAAGLQGQFLSYGRFQLLQSQSPQTQHFRRSCTEVDDGAFKADFAGSSIQNIGNFIAELVGYVLGSGRTHIAKRIGTRRR